MSQADNKRATKEATRATAKETTRAITEGAMLVGITVIMAFIDRYIPVLSLFLAIPIALLVVRRGLRVAALAACVVTSMLFAFMGLTAFVVVADVVIAGLSLGFAHRRFSQKPQFAFIVTAVGYVLSFVFIVYAVATILGATEVISMTSLIDRFLEMSESVSEKMSDLGASTSFVDSETIRPYLVMSIPAMIVLSGAGNAAIVFLIFRGLLSRLGHEVAQIPPFRSWRLSWGYGWGFVLGFLLLTLGGVVGSEIALRVGLNLFWIFYLVFMVQGLAVLYYYLARWRAATGVKAILLVIAAFTGVAQVIMTATPWLGVLDAWFDFRKLEVSPDASDSDRGPEGQG